MPKYLTLEKCEVINESEKAVLVAYEDDSGRAHTVWIPCSVIEDGDTLTEGDKDIQVAEWFVNKHDLPT